MINRRNVLLGLATGGVTVALATGAATFRVHRSARTFPKLTDKHLATLSNIDGPSHRLLFIGNSLVLGHDVPGKIEMRASSEGYRLYMATAAANGARLVETMRLSALRALLEPDRWDAVVLQDFTQTPLRRVDRWGSLLAMHYVARKIGSTPIILFPPFPGASKHGIYHRQRWLTTTPIDPADYARRTMAHYNTLATDPQFRVAPVPERWLADGNPKLYADDGHHASTVGADLIADVLWSSLKDILPDPS